MKKTMGINDKLDNVSNYVSDFWHNLADRDKLALSCLLAFFFALFLYFSWQFHVAAQSKQEDYQQKVSDLFWLRSQANNLKSSGANTSSQPLDEQIKMLISQQGIQNATVMQNDDEIQVVFSHSSQAVVAQALNRINAISNQFVDLEMQQDNGTKEITVQLVLQ